MTWIKTDNQKRRLKKPRFKIINCFPGVSGLRHSPDSAALARSNFQFPQDDYFTCFHIMFYDQIA